VHRVQIRSGIARGRRARRDGDQAKLGQEVQIFFHAVFAQPEQPGYGGDAGPTLPRGAVGIALQHGVQRDAKGADLGGVVVNETVIEAERMRAQRDDLCHGVFSVGIRP
jgi:hypothetical protein